MSFVCPTHLVAVNNGESVVPSVWDSSVEITAIILHMRRPGRRLRGVQLGSLPATSSVSPEHLARKEIPRANAVPDIPWSRCAIPGKPFRGGDATSVIYHLRRKRLSMAWSRNFVAKLLRFQPSILGAFHCT